MKKIAIIYGSNTDNTKKVAEDIATHLSDYKPEIKEVSTCSPKDFTQYDYLILGTSTWGLGELQDDWIDCLSKLSSISLSGKPISLFGLGDSASYSDTFVDGMRELYDFFEKKGCKIIGTAPAADYSFSSSRSVENEEFIGLPLDIDNEDDKTETRIKNWLEIIKPHLD